MAPPGHDIGREIESLLRELAPQVLGAAVRRFRDFAAAEDAVQQALIAAAEHWPRDGVPDDPRAWLIRVASRRIIDHVRAEAARRRREELVVGLVPAEDQLVMPGDDGAAARDDTLILLFMCGHPSLSPASAIALTLRAVGGLTTAEIARAFLVPEATMAQRISRAKQTIKAAGASFELPTAEHAADRLAAVLHVLYLMFSEGYTASSGAELTRTDLSGEALRLTRLLRRLVGTERSPEDRAPARGSGDREARDPTEEHEPGGRMQSGLLVPDDAEVAGLLALMLLTEARRPARTGPAGELIPLDEQDRSRWDAAAIAEGVALISATLPRGAVGAYQLQAAIAAVHDEAASAEATDWPQILALYGVLLQMSDNPMVALNHAIAIAMVHGPAAGLARLDELAGDPRLVDHHRLDAVRGHLHERAGDRAAAQACYERAAARTTSAPERDYLTMKAARLHAS